MDIVKSCTTNGEMAWTPHFKIQMQKRNVLMSDVLNVLDNGRISKPPEWNQDYEEYNYFISEEDSEGMKLTLKITISKEKDMVTLVTVY